MFRFRTIVIPYFGAGLLALTGCKSPPKRQPITPLTEARQEAPIAPVPTPAPTIPAPVIPSPAPVPFPATNQVRDTWISWEDWSLANGTDRPQPISPKAVHSYKLQSKNGTIAITVGSKLASWNGLTFWLGFAPQLIQGKPFVHALDAQKNFLPLLIPPEPCWRTNRTLLLDPGHGGTDAGTHHILNGRYEKEFTLDWALRIQKLLTEKGWQVYLTRTNDSSVSVADRVKLADQCHAGLFISLHFNSVSNAEASLARQNAGGLQTCCLTPTGMRSSIIRDNYPDLESAVFPSNDYDEQNFLFAMRLHQALVRNTDSEDGGVRRTRFPYILRFQRRPVVLIEGGYLSNPKEARLIAEAPYRQKLAEAVVKGLVED